MAVDAPLSVVCSWLSARGFPAVGRPIAAERRGSFRFEGRAGGVVGMLERVYSCGSFEAGGVQYFGGDPGRVFLTAELGAQDREDVRREVRALLPSTAVVAVLGDRVVIGADPADVEAIRALDWFSDRDYRVRFRFYEVGKDFRASVDGSVEIGLDRPLGDGVEGVFEAALRAGLESGSVVLTSSPVVSSPGGVWGELELTEERFFELFTSTGEGAAPEFRSGFERRSAGVLLKALPSAVGDGSVGVRYEIELSSFSDGGNKRVSRVEGAVRVRAGVEVAVAGLDEKGRERAVGLMRWLWETRTRKLVVTVEVEE